VHVVQICFCVSLFALFYLRAFSCHCQSLSWPYDRKDCQRIWRASNVLAATNPPTSTCLWSCVSCSYGPKPRSAPWTHFYCYKPRTFIEAT